jgi:hypothetical protein
MPHDDPCIRVCPIADLIELHDLKCTVERLDDAVYGLPETVERASKRLKDLGVEVRKQTAQLEALGAIGFARTEAELVRRNTELEADNTKLRTVVDALAKALHGWQATWLEFVAEKATQTAEKALAGDGESALGVKEEEVG